MDLELPLPCDPEVELKTANLALLFHHGNPFPTVAILKHAVKLVGRILFFH